MSKPDITVRDLRNRGREVIDRVLAGERLTVTRSGRPVAELRPLRSRHLSATELLRRWRRVPHVDPARLRDDVDTVIDMDL
ncbi:MAG: type II toxin-antitoxin system prevent-host-death family antitoxin [Trueperaceae bacterium]